MITHEDILKVQNGFWKIYKDFLQDGNMRKVNDESEKLHVYFAEERRDSDALQFCKDMFFIWAGIYNAIAADHLHLTEEEITRIYSEFWKAYKEHGNSYQEWKTKALMIATMAHANDFAAGFARDLRRAWEPVIQNIGG